MSRPARWIPWLLAVAAIAAAGVGAAASVASSWASGTWQIAVRRQVDQADAIRAGLEEVYAREVPEALAVAGARLRAEELTKAAANLAEPARSTVLADAAVQSAVADRLAAGAAPLVTDPRFGSPDGLDPGRRLAAVRGPVADGSPIPLRWQAEGDRTARRAVGLAAATIPVGAAFLAAALAGAFPARSRRFLVAGAGSLVMAVVWVAVLQLVV